MAFWGVEVKPGRSFTHKFDDLKGRLHLSMATLGFGVPTAKSILQCNIGDTSPVYLCTLSSETNESLQLNLEFEESEDVIFSVIGPRSIHLCGYYLGSGRRNNMIEESESYGEDIANETDRSNRSDEDEYEDSFIDDDANPQVYSESPISSEEEASPVNKRKDRRRRLKRKYQRVDSDDDCLPISSLCKGKATAKVLSNEIDVGDDKIESDANDKNDEDDGNITVKSNSKAGIVLDTPTHSGADPLGNLVEHQSVLDVGSVQTLQKKEKEREKVDKYVEAEDACDVHSIKRNTVLEGEPKMGNMAENLLIKNTQSDGQSYDKDPELSGNVAIALSATVLGPLKTRGMKRKKKDQAPKDSHFEDVNSHMKESKAPICPAETDIVIPKFSAGKNQDLRQNNKEDLELPAIVALPATVIGPVETRGIKKKKKDHAPKDSHLDDVNAHGKESKAPICSTDTDILIPKFSEGKNQDLLQNNKEDVELPGIVALPDIVISPVKSEEIKRKKKYQAPKDSHFEDVIAHKKQSKATICSAETDILIPNFSEGKNEDLQQNNKESGDNGAHDFPVVNPSDDKKIKKRRKNDKSNGNVEVNKSDMSQPSVDKNIRTTKKDENVVADAKPSKVKTMPNGLVIQELEKGIEDGKIAASGRKVSIFFTGKLKDKDEVVESNVGFAPFTFRLGKGRVMAGWDAGLEGMRMGEKRRLIIPPSMGLGSKGYEEKVPPNSWLVYDFELVKVR